MKRLIAILIAAAFILTLMPAGCGGDKGKAREYMNKGDAIISDLNTRYVEIGSRVDTLVSEYSQGINTETIGVKDELDEIKGLIGQAQVGAAEARVDYTGILELQGVQDYAQYAEFRLEMLNKLSQVDGVFSQNLALINSANTTGQPADVAQLASLGAQLETLGTEISALDQQAGDFKVRKKL
ncbi:MAG: hypothetical protein A2V52_06675 [Actinobacteria bacterium RBG_19FT_COMBO_54_7]|uniref:Lipoprotein n=1 Tax=Candidatus Solincola sediminis TaxID=1797199 RepID=A0A1F2WQZ5_9ACTN|nr:MAG: hypothetical protein A2Y75_10725 [Candidatus Solincola sediminis]OFW61117.1 MAG: hypothetical protein A2W01_00745 [Candidatus Solincola sediminis]OFW67200.1 MAG: hypothetical protein A2V52_06675 [Actinobacteria bacterium RBG_19FT_COMBO_54_7]